MNQLRIKGEVSRLPTVQATSNFIADRSMVALLFWLFGDFRCGVMLSIFLLYINIEIGKNRCCMLD